MFARDFIQGFLGTPQDSRAAPQGPVYRGGGAWVLQRGDVCFSAPQTDWLPLNHYASWGGGFRLHTSSVASAPDGMSSGPLPAQDLWGLRAAVSFLVFIRTFSKKELSRLSRSFSGLLTHVSVDFVTSEVPVQGPCCLFSC